MQEPDEQEDKPLDPVLEKVRRKMIRLQLVSASVMFISLMAVLGAVVYKSAKTTPPAPQPAALSAAVPSDQPLSIALRLPAGFQVTSTSLSGNQILFYGLLPNGKPKAFLADLSTGRVFADISFAE